MTYRNGYILNKDSETVGYYSNGYVLDKNKNVDGYDVTPKSWTV